MHSKEYDKAVELEKNGQWLDAARSFEKLLEEYPSIAVLSKCGWCFSRAGEYDLSKVQFEKLVEIDEKNPRWTYMLGYQYYMQKNWQEAVKFFDRSLILNKDYFIVLYRNAYANFQIAGEYLKLTKPEYWRAIGLLEHAHDVWTNMPEEQQQKEKDTYFDINFLHGKALLRLENYNKKAATLFQQALKIREDDVCRYNLSKCYYLMGEYEKAYNDLPKAQDYYVKELKAYIIAKMGRSEEAIVMIENLLKKKEKDYLLVALAEIYLTLNENIKAARCAKRAVALRKGNHKNYYTLAKSYVALGLLKNAKYVLEQAISIKRDRFNAEYQECQVLLKEIIPRLTESYCDDLDILKQIDSKPIRNFGVITKYFDDKGYGFISTNSGKVFFHVRDCDFKIIVGSKVSFVCEETDKGLNAKKVRQN